ncbi:hypothetical protein BXZ70DRAFT_289672 [Cristinia sonorae]|uniref:N-acetyltransferase domain-containing protein n=1 Tax=Cristinia sonorae TaxID=1940300 RepID=A0A8K0UM73_9AGAR|nr:hypothetical protein BXZ70DRAFT_289672 [Cristinia sonorae]
MDHPKSPLSPLLVNPATGEAYLQLPSPHENIIITPPRMSDAPDIIHHMSDPLVYKWLQGPPHPYLPSHAEYWLAQIKPPCDEILKHFDTELEQPTWMEVCPVRTLREVRPDGTDIMLGDIGIDRCGFPDVQDLEERERLSRENMARPTGDPEIVWCIGGKCPQSACNDDLTHAWCCCTDYLASSHHGRGIMSAALQTIITQWAIPRMNTRIIRGEAFKGNIGSVRVFEKNGFVLENTVDFEQVLNNGGKMSGMHVLVWRRSQQ